jgi:UDP-N-acetylenolpyruvoylglucosamine reductase
MVKKDTVCYEYDASRLRGKADLVVFPTTIEAIKDIIKEENRDIVPRGAGTNFVGGCIPNESVVVDLSRMNKLLDFNPKKMNIKVEAGMTLKELNERLSKANLEFPIIPLNEGISTIGGMIATNAVGDRSFAYGKVKDWIEAVEFVNGKGDLIKAGRADVSDVCGLEGITGIICNATLKLAPRINRTLSVFQTDSLEEVLSLARRLKSEKEISMIFFLSPFVSETLGFPNKYHLIIEFDSERGKISGKDYEEIRNKIKRIYYCLGKEGYYNSEDPKFFFDEIKDFVLDIEEKGLPYFGLLGINIIHVFFKDNEDDKRKEILRIMKEKGAKPGKYGIGLRRKELVDYTDASMISRIKSRHDPSKKINKNKLIEANFRESQLEKKSERKIENPVLRGKELVDLDKENQRKNEVDIKSIMTNSSATKKQEQSNLQEPKPKPKVNLDLIKSIMTNNKNKEEKK